MPDQHAELDTGPHHADGVASDETAPSEKGRATAHGRLAWPSLERVAQIVAIVGGVATLAFLLWDRVLKPSGPPESLGVTISNVTLQQNATLGTYLSLAGSLSTVTTQFEKQGLSKRDIQAVLGSKGVAVTFRLSITGPAGRQVRLSSLLQDASDGAIVPPSVPAPTGTITAQAGMDSASQLVWIPYPRKAGHYLASLRVYGDRGGLLATSPPQPVDVSKAGVGS